MHRHSTKDKSSTGLEENHGGCGGDEFRQTVMDTTVKAINRLMVIWFELFIGNPSQSYRERHLTYHMGSQSVTCHTKQVIASHHNPSQTNGTQFMYPGKMEG